MKKINNEEAKRAFRLAMIFSVLVFAIFTVTMIIMFTVVIIMHRLGFNFSRNFALPFIIFLIACVVVGTIFSQFVGKRATLPIKRASDAAKEVAKGNFNIKLDESIKAEEIRELAHSFNIMTDELAKIEILRNDFINNVSHEFKTPLSAIEGYAMLLQSKNIEEAKKSEYTAKIVQSVKRLSTLTGNILQLSKLDNQDRKIEKTTFSLDEQMREVILSFEKNWTQKNINLDIDLEKVTICGNQELLCEVWQNLISNALKFVSENGNLTMRLERHGSYCKATIKDDGIGMDSQTIDRIFEKFYQGDTSHATFGNGLGLTLVKKIVDLHGGSISVDSKVGEGTSFFITLPTI